MTRNQLHPTRVLLFFLFVFSGTTYAQQYGTPFTGVPDPRDGIIYQVNMRSFSPTQNFQSVIKRLDNIKSLGANIIYLMPIYPVGVLKTSNSPYCIKDYRGINKEFGDLSDLRALVDSAHKKNLTVILDWVANHTAWDNEWVTTHKDWYLQDSAGNIVDPPGRGWIDVAQLNFDSKALRQQMISDMKYWVYTANIDGFRMDFTDGPPIDFWKQAIDTLRNIKTHKLLLMAEGRKPENYKIGFDYNFGFSFFGKLKDIYEKDSTVTLIDRLNNTDYINANDRQLMVRYTTNHDVNSSDGIPEELFGGRKGAMSAFVIAAYMKSIPMVYTGQEVGTPYRIRFPFTAEKIDWTINPDVTAEYASILAFRNKSNAIRRGKLTSFSNNDICAFTKKMKGEKVFVISNVRNKEIDFIIPSSLKKTKWLNAITGEPVSLKEQITLQAHSYLILKNK
ncbi:MAG: alpha-amylase family glycosyl hydrolase [Bacteroidota bacterium]